jgi:hypothetical protein
MRLNKRAPTGQRAGHCTLHGHPRTAQIQSRVISVRRALARLTTMCSITARDHCAMGVQVSFMGVGVGSAAVKPGSGP